MADLEATALQRRIALPDHFVDPVTIEQVEREGAMFVVTVRTAQGRLEEVVLPEDRLRAALDGAPSSAEPVAARDLFRLVESARIRLSYAFDPHFAVSLSGVRALPHQLEAVYGRLLPQARLRFLLADDPGAGKTIMAGLLIKELRLRAAVERVLIVCPSPLTIQWQKELFEKFDESFERMDADRVKDQIQGNPWDRYPRCIVSLDTAKQPEVQPDILKVPWDLVIVDEAHKCSARRYGSEVKRTLRYQLAEALGRRAERLLFLTATPHQGDPEQFALFLQLLDPDQFAHLDLNRELLGIDRSPWFLRRMKEDLTDFEGRSLFPPRRVKTQPFELSAMEEDLYGEVTAYINRFLPRQAGGRKKASVALARMVLQRRLASSVRAIRRSLERRHERFSKLLDQIAGMDEAETTRRLRELNLLPDDPEAEGDDQDERQEEQAATGISAALRVADLRDEVAELTRLIALATSAEASGDEQKLRALQNCLQRSEFRELEDARGRLLIFTEHRDTLNYLRENLRRWGLSTCEIHGEMNALRRKDAELEFLRSAKVCIATEAAGEGINLQFCHLMINYDMPWNPNRLEQRMGRIHRIGQEYEVHVFNFVATNTVEGRILDTLLHKLDEIRTGLGDRVYDVIGMILQLNDVNLEEMLREASYNPRRIEEFQAQIRRLDPGRLATLEKDTGVALAVRHVDFARVRREDYASEERRLMPEYVERHFLDAAEQTGLRAEARADGLWQVAHVPERFRAPTLDAVRRHGQPAAEYRKLTFRKEHRARPAHADADLLSPGHPLFATVDEVLQGRLTTGKGGVACFRDPTTAAAYALHFFEVRVEGERPGSGGGTPKGEPVFAELLAVLEPESGAFELAPADRLHDLTADDGAGGLAQRWVLDGERRKRIERWVRVYAQNHRVERTRERRQEEHHVAREFLDRAFEQSLRLAQERWALLESRLLMGEDAVALARDEAAKRIGEIEARRQQKLADLDHLRVVRPGAITYVGTAAVRPVDDAAVAALMRRDDEVERLAMTAAMEHERRQGWEPEDISALRDGSGFDIRSLGPAEADARRPVRRIEVKGRSAEAGDVVLTANEWLQARRHGESYWLYVVYGCKMPAPRLVRVQDPARALVAEELTVVKGYRIAGDALAKAGDLR